MSRGYLPQKPVTMITENGDESALESVKQTAEQGVSLAQNARQMVLNDRQTTAQDRARIATVEQNTLTLQQLADDYQARLAESLADRAALTNQVQSLATDMHDEAENRATYDASLQAAVSGLNARVDNIQLTPGPAGKDGTNGKDGAPGTPGRDGTDGKTGTPGANGADGKSAYQIARDNGYGGTQTQWLASLTGAQGATGAKGDPGKDFDPTIANALAARIATLEGARTLAYGMASTPTLALLAVTDVTVPLSRTMPDTNYVIELGKSSNLRDDMITLKTKTTIAVTYTVKAIVAIGAGTLAVIARY
jgi:hypothetical protein